MQKVHIPFDGFGKTTNEAAEIISQHLKNSERENIMFVLPAQWAWDVHNLIHPNCGLVTLLRGDVNITQNYNVDCYANYKEMGVTACLC